MRLVAAAQAFNKSLCSDGYSGQPLFYGQLGLFDDNKRDSETAERRILSVADGTALPARRVIELAGSRYILGHSNPDTFRGQVIRRGIVLHEATSKATLLTLAQACLLQTGVSAWAGRAWVKNAAFTEQSSHLAPEHHLHVAVGEPLVENMLAIFEGQTMVVRAVVDGAAGTRVGLCDVLPAPAIEVVTAGASVYDPISDTMTGTTASIRVVRVRWQSMFRYGSKGAPSFGPDDIQVVIAKAAYTPLPGTLLTMSDGVRQIAAASDEGDVWLCRATRHD